MRQEPSSKPLTVAIVEDHPEFRVALSQALTHTGALQLLEVCKDLPAGMALVRRECPDVLLVDLGLPSGSGLQLIRSALRRWGRRCTSAVLTVTGNEEHLQTAVAAAGYAGGHLSLGCWRANCRNRLFGMRQCPSFGGLTSAVTFDDTSARNGGRSCAWTGCTAPLSCATN